MIHPSRVMVRGLVERVGPVMGLCALVATGISQDRPDSLGLSRAEAARRASLLRVLGQRMFADVSLSRSGQLSCATCHDPSRAFGPPDGRDVRPGGAFTAVTGLRAIPSLRYLQRVPPFTRHFYASAEEGNESVDNGPTGGLTWDGRVDRGRDQARLPLLSLDEMANPSASSVEAEIRGAAYGPDAERLASHGESLFDVGLEALEAYEQDGAVFAPYSSRYDATLRRTTTLTLEEQEGLDAFNDPKRGNCASCHPSRPDARGIPPAFSDFGFVALGVPRNRDLPANADAGVFDLGLCGPVRTTLAAHPEYCGRFRAPTLRNVATRPVFFHNGVVHSLRDAVAFYATRDTQPERWYPRGPTGELMVFDDLPPAYRRNLENGPPFGRRRGDSPSLTSADIDAIVAFLNTLTDADVNVVRRTNGSPR